MGRPIDEPFTIILDHGASSPTFWVVKSKTRLVAVMDDGDVLHAEFKGQLWEGASTINNRHLAWDTKLRFGHGVSIGREWVGVDRLFRLKVKDLRRDQKAILEVLECPPDHGWRVGLEITLPIEELRRDYQEVPHEKNTTEEEDHERGN